MLPPWYDMSKWWWGVLLLGCGCASNTERLLQENVPAQAGMRKMEVPADGFTLTAYARLTRPGLPLRVYIEGDGYAWISRDRASSDPTPHHALALSLALADTSPNVVYLARPCQYSLALSPQCQATYWTHRRFSEEVVIAMNRAVDAMRNPTSGQTVELVGYSGGAAIAVLLAARRQDVSALYTVAGNLDTEAVNRYHRVSPMPLSLNPVDAAARVAHIPQLHLVGIDDKIIPAFVAERFVAAMGGDCEGMIQHVAGATHGNGWLQHWPMLLKSPHKCADVQR